MKFMFEWTKLKFQLPCIIKFLTFKFKPNILQIANNELISLIFVIGQFKQLCVHMNCAYYLYASVLHCD